MPPAQMAPARPLAFPSFYGSKGLGLMAGCCFLLVITALLAGAWDTEDEMLGRTGGS